jgi:hypothetical protein
MWGWKCLDDRCQKFKLSEENFSSAVGLNMCRFSCGGKGNEGIWPKPTEIVDISGSFVAIDVSAIEFVTESFKPNPELWLKAQERFMEMQQRKVKSKKPNTQGASKLVVQVVADSDDMSETFYSHLQRQKLHPKFPFQV